MVSKCPAVVGIVRHPCLGCNSAACVGSEFAAGSVSGMRPTAHSTFESRHERCLLLALHRVARDGDSSCDCSGCVALLEPSVMQRTGIGAPSQDVRIGELRAVEEVVHPCVQLQRPPGRAAATMWSGNPASGLSVARRCRRLGQVGRCFLRWFLCRTDLRCSGLGVAE